MEAPGNPTSSDSPGYLRAGPGRTIRAEALTITFASSSGPGGQNVNKRATKCLLRVRLADLPLDPVQADRLRTLAGAALVGDDELLIIGDEYRSQGRNRDACIERLLTMVRQALVRPKQRRATRPTKGSVERRLRDKRATSERKNRRGTSDD
jgi:ribosome-associated protein